MNNIYIRILMLVMLIMSSCKSKSVNSEIIKIRPISKKKLLKNHEFSFFNESTLSGKLKIHYNDVDQSKRIQIKLRLEKNSKIWLSASFLGIPIAKLYLTPDRAQFYDKVNLIYFDGNYTILSRWLGVDLNFQKVQSLLLGNMIEPRLLSDFSMSNTPDGYVLESKESGHILIYLVYLLDPIHFKLKHQKISNNFKNKSLSVVYHTYKKIKNEWIPEKVTFDVRENKKQFNIIIEYKSIELNKSLTFPFKIPNGYKRIISS